ncbi:hypothetical protein SUGI_0218400 [Cryptomeria japonica]|nr:hypothetical protein SUGI_0218400 [Cryptomeria japonica]
MSTKKIGFVSGSSSSSKADVKECQADEEGKLDTQSSKSFLSTTQRLKKEISANRDVYVKGRIESNKRNLELYTANLLSLSESRKGTSSTGKEEAKDNLIYRMEKMATSDFSLDSTAGEKESANFQGEGSSASSIGSCEGLEAVRDMNRVNN